MAPWSLQTGLVGEHDEGDFKRRYTASLEHERARAEAEDHGERRLCAIYVGSGAIGLGLLGLLIGPGGFWRDPSLGERVSMAALFAVGGASVGLRLWRFRDRD
jgi:hypothetical protein